MDDSSTLAKKRCRRCQQLLSLASFKRDKSKRDGYRATCKSCAKIPKTALPPVPIGYKRCRSCMEIKLATKDFFDATALYQSPDGLSKQCKVCCKAYRQARKNSRPADIIPRHSDRKCRDCKRIFPATLNYFALDRSNPDGLRPICKNCANKRSLAYRKKEGSKEKRQSYRKTRAEREKSYRKSYREQHKEQEKTYTQRYRITENYRQSQRAYRQSEKGRRTKQVHVLNRIARKKQSQGIYTAQQIREQYQRQKGHCYYCKIKFHKGKNAYHIDHVVPLARGGSNDMSNIVLACPPCNLSKGDKLLHEWERSPRLL